MPTRILFLTNPYFHQPTLEALCRIKPDCETSVVVYDSFDHIPQVFAGHADGFDAVMITGTSAKHVLDVACPDNQKPVVAFQVDSDALHRYILRFAIETQNLDFSRIAVDFLVPLDSGCSVVDFLRQEDMACFIRRNDSLTEAVFSNDQCSLESVILNGILALWEQNAIDMVLCLYASIVPELEKRGIPFRCPFISDGHLKRLIRDVQTKVELKKLHDNHPAIIQIFPRHISPASPDHIRHMKAAVQQYLQTNMIDCVVQVNNNSCVLITTLQILKFLTNDFQVCRFSSYLAEALDFPVNVAYGVGTSVSHAMNNVQIASKEATLLSQSFVVDSNGSLIGPLSSEKRMVIHAHSMPDVSEIAKNCSLSAMTIQRLISMVHSSGSDKITTQELAQRLNTTIRNANRIMLNLCKGNVAKPVYTQTSHSRGRPVQVYSLNFGTKLT